MRSFGLITADSTPSSNSLESFVEEIEGFGWDDFKKAIEKWASSEGLSDENNQARQPVNRANQFIR